MITKELNDKMKKSIELAEEIWQYAKDNNLTDYQKFLDWQDSLNAISVR